MANMPAHERRRQIVEAAVVVMREVGLEGASIRRIATQAGAPLASVHYTFRDKDELFAAVYAHWVEGMADLLAGLVPDRCGLEAGVRNLATGFFDWITADPTLGLAEYELVLWAARNQPTGLSGSIYDSFDAVCRDALRRASTGEHDDQALAEVTEILISALDGILLRFLVERDADAARRNLERFITIALSAAR